MSDISWVQCSVYDGVPANAVIGGQEEDGTNIYVGRAYHDGSCVPAKVIPEKSIAYIAFDGAEHAKYECEVLCEEEGQKFEWHGCSGGCTPPNAIGGGETSDGEVLYIGRTCHRNSQVIGKVHPSHNCMYIPFDGAELRCECYEILVSL